MKLLVQTAFSPRGMAAWLILLLGLLATATLWHSLLTNQQQRAQAEFELHNREVLAAIQKRLQGHEQILLSGAALFDASEQVDRDEWRNFVARLKLEQNYPGIQGVGVVKAIPAAELAVYQADAKNQQLPQIHPSGEREFYTAIMYLEPDNERNRAALGYDMFSESIRRKAMQYAVENNSTTISGKVTLKQEIKGPQQAGFLMYVPVFYNNRPVATAAERWAALFGFVYSPYRIDDLMQGILGNRDLMVDFTIHDGEQASDATLMHNSARWHEPEPNHKALYSSRYLIPSYGHQWLITLTSRHAFERQFESLLNWSLPLSGVAISSLLFLLVLQLLSRQQQALALAERMAKQRAESEARFHQLFLHMGQGVLIYNASAALVDVNPAALKLMGLTMAQLQGNTALPGDWQINPPQALPPAPLQSVLDVLVSGEGKTSEEIGFWHSELQSYLWCNLDLYPQFAADTQQLEKIYLVLSDITERKRVAQMKDEFVATVSHELRTPLTSISGALDLLCHQVLEDEGHAALKQHMLQVAYDNSKRLTMLINDLLDLEKIAAGGMSFDIKPQLLMPILTMSVEANQVSGSKRGIRLELTPPDEDVPVLVDSLRLQQVLANLLSNAIKFSPDNSVVRLGLSTVPGFIRISVCDSGEGIPQQFRPMIFQKFSQADASSSKRQQGTGLGLAICKELVERMQGRISFSSEEGVGSCFYVDLPIA